MFRRVEEDTLLGISKVISRAETIKKTVKEKHAEPETGSHKKDSLDIESGIGGDTLGPITETQEKKQEDLAPDSETAQESAAKETAKKSQAGEAKKGTEHVDPQHAASSEKEDAKAQAQSEASASSQRQEAQMEEGKRSIDFERELNKELINALKDQVEYLKQQMETKDKQLQNKDELIRNFQVLMKNDRDRILELEMKLSEDVEPEAEHAEAVEEAPVVKQTVQVTEKKGIWSIFRRSS